MVSVAESVSSFADRFFALAESIKNEIDGATGVAVIEAEDIADDNLDGTSEATTTEGPGLLNEQFHEQIKKILERDRLVLGKGN